MSLFRSILLLAGAVCSVSFAYFFGHGLSTGHGKPYLLGAVLLAAGVILLTLFHKTGRSDGATSQH